MLPIDHPRKLRVGIDVDGVLAIDVVYKWLDKCFYKTCWDRFKTYDSFKHFLENEKNKQYFKVKYPMSFWKNPKMYDKINYYHNQVFNILKGYKDLETESNHIDEVEFCIVSDCFKQVVDSKVRLCNRIFKAMGFEYKYFYNTKNKYEILLDVLIDDRPTNLINCKLFYKGNKKPTTILIEHEYNKLENLEHGKQYIDRVIRIENMYDICMFKEGEVR